MSDPLFIVDSTLSIPKYQQIVDGVVNAIERKVARRGDVLPSVSQLCTDFSLSRETVVKAYAELKKQGIIEAIPRKGYYVASEYVRHTAKVFVLFDMFTPYKQDLYSAFKDELGDDVVIDMYFHHFNTDMFEALLLDNMGKYGMYVVMSYPHDRMLSILDTLDRDKLLMLDRSYLLFLDRCKELAGSYSFICQDYNTNLYSSLESALHLIQKYRRMIMVFPLHSHHPTSILDGFRRFCLEHDVEHDIIHDLRQEQIREQSAYFVIDDPDLVQIVERCKAHGYVLGQDVGVLSYNETDMKRVVAEGITVVSVDFADMGRRAARYIKNPQKIQEVVPTHLIVRRSL